MVINMKVLVIGTVGLQVNIPINNFPLNYQSIYFMDDKVDVDLAGVGYSSLNILKKLHNDVTFITGIGNDFFSDYIISDLKKKDIDLYYERKKTKTLISTILYDQDGKRSILREGRKDYMYVMDPRVYESIDFRFDYAIVTLTNFARHILKDIKNKKIPMACDMQTIDNLTNNYGKDFMEASNIIFFSNDHYDQDIEELVKSLYDKYHYEIIGVGMGAKGCLLCVDGKISYYNAYPVKVVNTVGAGDTLFTSFVHFYYTDKDPDLAIRKALLYTSEKIKYKTSSEGFMDLNEFKELYEKII